MMKTKLELFMKNYIILIIGLYFLSCNESINKNADRLWNDGQKYRAEEKLKEFAMSFDWGMISIEYYDYIKKITEENK